MFKNKKTPYPLSIMVAAALLVAMSIVLGKYLAIRVGDTLRFSFENMPILLAGMAFGPAIGALVGLAADLIGCLLVGYAINPIITLGAVSIGLLSGVLYRILHRLPQVVRVIIAVTAAHLVGSVLIKTVGLTVFFNVPFWYTMWSRVLNYLPIIVAETVLLYVVLKSKAIRNQLDALRR